MRWLGQNNDNFGNPACERFRLIVESGTKSNLPSFALRVGIGAMGSLRIDVMANPETAALPVLSAEHRRVAAERFDRANQVVTSGEFDYGIQLLLTCCKLDPTNMLFRQTLRRTQKAKSCS